jgi:importin-4
MPLVLKELASSDATNRRNAAFCAGEICKNGGAAALKYVFFSRIIIFDDARK